MLLLCSILVLIELSGMALQKYVPQLLERVFDGITDAVFMLASP
jgi:hypothetical protein